MWFSGCAPGPMGVLKRMRLAHFGGVWTVGTPYVSEERLQGPRMHRNMPQGQRMRQKDQQVTGSDTKTDSEVACKGTKLCQNAK